jgi:hypothetical protein
MKRTPMKRKTRVRPRNPKRRASEFARCYGSKERVAFVKSLPCIVRRSLSFAVCDGEIHNHHTKNDGIGRKGPASSIVPLCSRHHELLHEGGSEAFSDAYGLPLNALAADTERRWQRHQRERGDET